MTARTSRAFTAGILAASLGILPCGSALAAAADAQHASDARAEAALAGGCGSETAGGDRQIADDTGSQPTDATAATPAQPSSPPSAAASPTTGASGSPSPAPTYAGPTPFSGLIRGPGTLIAPSSTTSPGVTPPPVPTASAVPVATGGPVFLTRTTPVPSTSPGAATPTPATSGTPAVSPSPAPTLGPGQIAILADTVTGATRFDKPADADGNVHVFYRDGVMVGDHAHYDGNRYVTITGHPYLENNNADSRLYADEIIFDVQTNHAELRNGNGSTTRGVEQGRVYYKADQLTADSRGRVHGKHASFSTCENPRGGYHVTARSIDVTPGEKLVAHGATFFLGALAIFFIPVLSIPLNRSINQRHPVVFAPEFGYDQGDGAYVRARIGFGSTNTYYGYYRVEEYSRRGLGLGYVAFIGSRNGRRQVNIDFYDFSNSGSQGGGHNDNLSVQEKEVFSKTTQAQFGGTYTSEYGPYVSLPPSYSFNAALNHTSKKSTQSYSYSRTAVGGQQSTDNSAFQDTYQFSNNLTEALNLNLTQNVNSYAGVTTPTSSLHLNSVTHATSRSADYDFTVDQTDSATPSGYNKVPEFVYHPHGGHGVIPIDTQLTLGTYHELTPITLLDGTTEPGREAQRADLDVTAGPALFKVLNTSTLSATLGGSQYYYSTGDLKAQTRQTVNLTTPFGTHISNVVQYQEQNLAGPQSLPFQYLDVLGSVTHNAQETLSFSNGGIYTLTLTTGTSFDHTSQPISYQLISRPSSRSYLSVGGSYIPGMGNGFETTNLQVATPFGRDQQLEFTTNIDWKNKGRLEDKNIYFRKIVGNCYDIRLSYNQDLKAVNVSLDLLAFPSHGANFGFVSQQQAIFPQNFVVQ